MNIDLTVLIIALALRLESKRLALYDPPHNSSVFYQRLTLTFNQFSILLGSTAKHSTVIFLRTEGSFYCISTVLLAPSLFSLSDAPKPIEPVSERQTPSQPK